MDKARLLRTARLSVIVVACAAGLASVATRFSWQDRSRLRASAVGRSPPKRALIGAAQGLPLKTAGKNWLLSPTKLPLRRRLGTQSTAPAPARWRRRAAVRRGRNRSAQMAHFSSIQKSRPISPRHRARQSCVGRCGRRRDARTLLCVVQSRHFTVDDQDARSRGEQERIGPRPIVLRFPRRRSAELDLRLSCFDPTCLQGVRKQVGLHRLPRRAAQDARRRH